MDRERKESKLSMAVHFYDSSLWSELHSKGTKDPLKTFELFQPRFKMLQTNTVRIWRQNRQSKYTISGDKVCIHGTVKILAW